MTALPLPALGDRVLLVTSHDDVLLQQRIGQMGHVVGTHLQQRIGQMGHVVGTHLPDLYDDQADRDYWLELMVQWPDGAKDSLFAHEVEVWP